MQRLVFLKEKGWLASAAEVEQPAIRAGRKMVPQVGGPSAFDGGSMNSRSLRRCIALAGLAASTMLVGSGAIAQATAARDSDEAMRAAFAAADANKDGVINVDEAVGDSVLLFITLDKNRDRFLTRDELPRYDPARLKAADRDGDGKLSVGEVAADRVWEFFEADTDGSGVATYEEVRGYVSRVRGAPR